ncbi:DUF2076 domain-containing protein [Siccirubricoccus phaeus]|uniref:DUF2076 domain-containing protein n=1 Tax=Siccirubricoccus phaeus TaxID=2595053 RepID=UPI0011F1AF51|nr:DUF2076 domain-containing protein [Siccirubricoccus phaeus]
MNDEERRIITQFVERIAGVAPAPSASASARPWGGGSVPQTAPNLPPVDREADALIADLFARYPEARYRIAQTAFVQEAALVEAQNRLRQMEWELENARREAQAAQQAPRGGGLFGGMFGGGGGNQRPAAPMPPPPQPVYPPGYNPGMLQPQRSGPGFLGTALTTAAGVAGGMVLGNMLMNAFSQHGASAATAATDLAGGAADALPAASPWSDPGAAAAAAGWGADGGEKSAWGGAEKDFSQSDATPASYDDSSGGYDDGSGYDDGGSGDEDI